MALVITKKVRTILLIVLAVLVVGAGGFLIWRVTQEESLSPEEGEAGLSQAQCEEAGCNWHTAINQCVGSGWCRDGGSPGELECSDCRSDEFCSNGWLCCDKCEVSEPPPGEEPDCGDYITTSTVNNCPNDPYTYACGTHCYTQVNGEACCGLPDDCVAEYPNYNSLPYTTPAASQKSELVLYYSVISPYSSLARFIIVGPDGQSHTIDAGSGKDRITTGIILETGETARIKTVYDSPGGKLSVGWQSLNADNTCGSGAMGPPQNNDCERYEKKDVSTFISWANNAGDDSVFSSQCWADSKEWEGDYDFNDYFVQFAYLPIAEELVEPSCGTYEGNYTAVTTEWPLEGTYCSVGTPDPEEPTFPALGGQTDWTCNIDGNTVDCLATRDNVNDPACGTYEGNYSSDTTDWPLEGTYCSVGTPDPEEPTFPTLGGETTWTCNNDGNTVSCLATRDNVADPYCGDGEVNGGEVCDPSAPDGGTCVDNLGETVSCNDDCTCPITILTNPDWTIDKTAVSQYVVINEENFANANYTITVTNVGDGDGNLDRIVDDLDDKVLESYIQEISNNGTYLSGSITWDLEGEDELFTPQESLVLTYSIQIPQEAYGVYDNIVTAYPTDGGEFSDYARITLVADEEEQPTTVPQTGIFDSVLGKISLGVSFIFLGLLVTQYSTLNYFFNSVSEKREILLETKREKRINRRRERLESRFEDD